MDVVMPIDSNNKTDAPGHTRSDKIKHIVIAAGNQAELYHLAQHLSMYYRVTLMRPPAFSLFSKLMRKRAIRSSFDLSEVYSVIEVGHLHWFVERTFNAYLPLRKLHSKAITSALDHTARRYSSLYKKINADYVIGNFMVSHYLAAEIDNLVLNYPFVAPDQKEFANWNSSFDADEQEGLFVDNDYAAKLTQEITRARLILCGSKFAKESFDHTDIKNKTAVVPFGYDTMLFFPNKIRNCKNPNLLKILYVGPRTYRKGADIIEGIANEIDRIDQVATFTIAGRGWENGRKKLDSKKICIKNKTGQDELAQLFREHHFLVMPSRAEGMGLVGLEAKACGCVPIVSNRGPEEYVTDGIDGFVVTKLSVEAWVETVALKVNSENFNLMHNKASSYALKYSWKAYSEKAMKAIFT